MARIVKYKYYLLLVLLVGMVIILVGAKGGQKPAASEKLFPIYHVDITRGSKTGTKLLLAGAKNEYLTLFFRVEGADKASFKIDVRKKSPAPDTSYTFYQVRPIPFMDRSIRNMPPDVLVPLEQGLANIVPLDILVTIKISSTSARGIHSQELIFSDNKGSFTLPLDLKVWNFSLQDDLPITIMGVLWGVEEWFAPYGVNSRNQFDLVIRKYLRSMREYKFNALGPRTYPIDTGKITSDKRLEEQFPEYDKIIRYSVNDLHYRYFCIPRITGLGKKELQNKNMLLQPAKEFFPPFTAYLRRNGWEKKALNKLMDEPILPYLPSVYESYALTKQMAPALKTFCTGRAPEPRLAKVINIWAMSGRYYNPDSVDAARAQGQEIWVYYNRLHKLHSPPAFQRLIGWMLYRYRFSGYVFWGVNYWPKNVWSASTEPIDSKSGGIYYYPNPQDGSPWPTTRIEALRRGLQDYQFLILLDQAKAQGKITPETFSTIYQRIKLLTQPLPGMEAKVSMSEMENLRYHIGEILDKAMVNP